MLHRIAFGSCAKHSQYQPIWRAIIDEKPDLFLFLGDAIYSDTDGSTAWTVTEKQLQGEWNRLADKPEFQRFRSQVPIMATWDNHDYGTHNGGAEFELKEVSKRMFPEVSKIETGAYPLFEFTSSGLTHINEAYAKADNSYCVAGPLAELNFGYVEVDWDTKPSPMITLTTHDAKVSTAFSLRIPLSKLR